MAFPRAFRALWRGIFVGLYDAARREERLELQTLEVDASAQRIHSAPGRCPSQGGSLLS
jgi:hypothetical protein